MSARRHYRSIADLPAAIPVFPLTGALLLPRARAPFNIFEPRYLSMVDDAMDSGRVIGLIQPRDGDDKAVGPLAAVGCAGRIVEYGESDDGRYTITLLGIARFRVAGEPETGTPFRQVTADYGAFADDLHATADPPIARERLMLALKPYLRDRAMKTDWKSIEDAPSEALINALAMLCPFEPKEKQALLEAPGLKERSDALIALLEIANAASPNSRGGQPLH